MNNFNLPSITEDSLNSAKERKAILDALYSLSEQLRRTYASIDEESFSPAYLAKVKKVQEAADNVSVLREQLLSAREALLKEISAKATAVEDKFMSELYTDESRQTSKFVQQTDYETTIGDFRQELSSVVEQDAIKVLLQFQDKLKNEDGTPVNLDGLDVGALPDLTTRIIFSAEGMSINKDGENPYMQLTNESITFQQDVSDKVQELAKLSASEGLYASRIESVDIHASNGISAEKSVGAGRFEFVDEGTLGFSLVLKEE